MKVVTNKESLLKALSTAQEAISNKSYVSILSNVLLKTAENKVIVQSTDLKVSIITSFGADIEEDGETTIFADKLISSVSSLPSGEIEISSKDNEVIVKPLGKKIKFSINSIATDKFPVIDSFKEDGSFYIAAKDLKKLAYNTIFAVSTDSCRYFMTGCYLTKSEDKLTMVATDGRRMSVCKLDSFIPEVKSCIIPTKILALCIKFCDEGDVKVNISDKLLMIKYGNLEMTTVLIEGQYPKWERVLPESYNNTVSVAKADIEAAIKRVFVMSDKSGRIKLNMESGKIIVSSPESEIGKSKEEIEAKYNGEPIEIALNAQYLTDILKVLTAENITFDFIVEEDKSVKRAIAVKDSEKASSNCTHVMMPMSL